MEILIPGKLYLIYSALRDEGDVIASPFSTFVFATKDPYADIEDAGITLINGTLVVYLGECIVTVMQFKMHPILEEATYYKLLVEDQILYVLDDGYTSFERANNDFLLS
jgi:hypothetical protein